MTLRVACSALGKRIFAGHPTKDGTRFREPRHDVTSDVLKAVIDKIEIGNEVEVSDGESVIARIAVLPPAATPARAEAQDEGESGEPVAKVVRKGFSTGSISWTKFGQDADLSDETPLYAHPCPTPAADADRVRIAVEALEAERAWHERVADFAFDDAREASEREEETSERDAMRRMNVHNERVSIIGAALATLKSEGK